MGKDRELYEVRGELFFQNCSSVQDFYVCPAVDEEGARRTYLDRYAHFKKSIYADVFGVRLERVTIKEIREVDISEFGYRIQLEELADRLVEKISTG